MNNEKKDIVYFVGGIPEQTNEIPPKMNTITEQRRANVSPIEHKLPVFAPYQERKIEAVVEPEQLLRQDEAQNAEPNKTTVPKKAKNAFLTSLFGGMVGALIICLLFFGINTVISNYHGVTTKTGTTTIINNTIGEDTTLEQVVVETVSKGVVTILVDDMFSTIGSGSGVIYKIMNDKVYIVTNAHVVDGGKTVRVYRNDLGQEYAKKTKVLAVDIEKDIAILEVEGSRSDYPVVMEFADSDILKIGQRVLAIGSPLGPVFSGSVTSGVVSGLNRQVPVDSVGNTQSFIQTDAAMNGGNSGGALVNMNGQLIGINSAKIEAAENIGLAIPVNFVLETMQELGVPLPDSNA